MRAIEIASQHNWTQLWLESDSMLVVNAFKNHALVPWKLSNRWYNCIHIVLRIRFPLYTSIRVLQVAKKGLSKRIGTFS
ncbi:hypothetical protein MTR_6g038610 [Medicago truncatula]|uniref:RNase H type-1 domain-containing protein n=1 Tax=Medicago truncatula TaxID=3880 RepID=A0A072U8J3_MEDTR|nr:hypothetical protein MTR_6g038610 [Medicago truncatula]